MIYVRIELWPLGSRKRAKLLAEAVIANDDTGTSASGNYVAHLSKRGGFGLSSVLEHVERLSRVWRRVHVRGLTRNRVGAVWELLRMVAEEAASRR